MGDGPGGSELAGALRPRFVDTRAGLYESLYFTAHHPVEPQALWVRYTVLKARDAKPRASLWCTWFGAGGVRAGKVSTAAASSSPQRPLEVGGQGWIGAGGAAGTIDVDGLRASWELTFHDPEPPLLHLPRPGMYRGPVPRTKSLSATPMARLRGSLAVAGQAVDVDGWPCSIGHNWGAEHAERWIWMHADGATEDGPVWLDVVVGRIRLGPVTSPCIANGALSLGGHRHRLGGLRPGVRTRVTEHPRGATVALRGRGLAVDVQAEVDLAGCVAWTYADPAGHTREVVNSSVAAIMLTIERGDGTPLQVQAPVAAFEIGAPRRALDVPLQPYAD